MAYRSSTSGRGNRRRDSVLKAAARSVEHRRIRHRRWGLVVTLLVGVPALLAGLAWGGHAAWRAMFSENDFFLIRHIEITTDGTLGRGHIQEYAKVQTGINLFAVHPDEIREWLLLVPVIADVRVGRRLPDTLVIDVAERVGVARLGRPGAGSPLAVDAVGHVLGPSSVRASLPVILGVRDKGLRPGDVVQDPMLQEALQVLDICNQADMRRDLVVATIDLRHPEYLDIGLATGEQVLLSRQRLAEKLWQLTAMRAAARQHGLDLAVYDMTVDRNFVGRPAAWRDPAEDFRP